MLLNTLYVFFNGIWSQHTDLPESRRKLAAVATSDSDIMLCGGVGYSGSSAACWLYDHINGGWTTLSKTNYAHTLGGDVKNSFSDQTSEVL